MAAGEKTNAIRLLDSRKVKYEAFTYDNSFHSATEVAEILGVPHEIVYKTLVVLRARGKPLLVIVPGGFDLDLKALAKALDEKSLRMATYKEAEQLTGLQVGGVSALALTNKPFEVVLDEAALIWPQIFVSGGRRGLNVRISPTDLVALTRARVIPAIASAGH